jgi:Zn-finger protein
MGSKRTRNNAQRLKASSHYFENRDCEYYPCHKIETEGFNCLFCFCPLYFAICPGTPHYEEQNRVMFKTCTECEYPHRPENYQAIVEFIAAMLKDESDK